MPTHTYDELRMSTDQPTSLSVTRWNALVDELQRVDNTLNRIHVSAEERGRIGIGTVPARALHIEGNGGVSDDLLISSITNKKSFSAAIIMERRRSAGALEDSTKIGQLSFRAFNQETMTASAGIHVYQRNTGSKYSSEMNLLHTRNGQSRTAMAIQSSGDIHLNGRVRGGQPGGVLRIQSTHGYVQIGSENESFAHIKTDRGRFYFNKKIITKGGQFEAYSKDNLSLISSGKTRLRILGGSGSNAGYIGLGTTAPKAPLHVKGQLRVEGGGGTRGWIIVGSYANDDAARELLRTIGNRQLIIGGIWGDNVYFYWKNGDGKRRRAKLRGGSF